MSEHSEAASSVDESSTDHSRPRQKRYSPAANGGVTQVQRVMALVNEGLTNQQIAERLGIPLGRVTSCKARHNRLNGTQKKKCHYVKGTLRERWEAKVNRNGPVPAHRPELGPCHQWIAGTAHFGYGMIHDDDGKTAHKAHRLAYEWYVGPIPEGMFLLHKCDNPRCVRPDHLEPGTQADNMADKMAKGRANNKKWADALCGICRERGHRRNKCPKREAA